MPIPKGYEVVNDIPEGYEPVEGNLVEPQPRQNRFSMVDSMISGAEDQRAFSGEMISNVPESAAEFGVNVVTPFLHPIDTAKSVYNLGVGAAQKLIPGEQGKEQYADAMGKFISDRYGSVESFKETAKSDPVGLLADISMVLTGGGAAAARAPGIVGKFGRGLQKVGKATEPLNLAKGASKLAASKLVSKIDPVGLYESSAKFSTTIPKGRRRSMAETALKHKILPTDAGVDKLQAITDSFSSKVDGLISEATKAGKTIPKGAIFKHITALRKELGGAKIGASKNLRQVNKAVKELDIQLKKTGNKRLTPDELQTLKQSAYDDVSYEATRLRSQSGTEAATKAIAKGAKEAIENIADVKDLNRELGDLLGLKKPLSKAAGRIENRNVVSIDAPIKIAAGQAAGGPAGAALGTGLAILEHPKIKARLAIAIKKIQDSGKLNQIDPSLLPTLVHYGLLQAGRAAQLPTADDE